MSIENVEKLRLLKLLKLKRLRKVETTNLYLGLSEENLLPCKELKNIKKCLALGYKEKKI